MSDTFRTKNVFIDTEIFVRANFSVDSGPFQALGDLCQGGAVRLILTDITLFEITANQREAVASADTALKKVRDKARVLRNLKSPSFSVVFDFDRDMAIEQLRRMIDKFLDYTKADVLDATETDAKPVFEAYFSSHPPFGEGKNKAEFPDAFVIQALLGWCESRSEEIYVVSKDKGMIEACKTFEPLHSLESLPEFIDLALGHTTPWVKCAHDSLNLHRSKIEQMIASEFDGLVMWLEDEDGEGEIVEVGKLTLEPESIVKVDSEVAVFSADAAVSFTASISYYEQGSGYYDREDNRHYYRNTIRDVVDRSLIVPVEFCLRFDVDAPEDYSIEEVEINRGKELSILADEGAATHWK